MFSASFQSPQFKSIIIEPPANLNVLNLKVLNFNIFLFNLFKIQKMNFSKITIDRFFSFFLINLKLLIFYTEPTMFFTLKIAELFYGKSLYTIEYKIKLDEDQNIYIEVDSDDITTSVDGS